MTTFRPSNEMYVCELWLNSTHEGNFEFSHQLQSWRSEIVSDTITLGHYISHVHTQRTTRQSPCIADRSFVQAMHYTSQVVLLKNY